ncbi:MAG: S46 family peptidase [Bacteroidaceae bacterium]
MKKMKLFILAIFIGSASAVFADEGMWLLQMMQQQHLIDQMKKQGLKLELKEIYNPNGVSLKDAVGIFGGGCTGEIVSSKGLIFTNHHCGFGAIQEHSSVEHNYLRDGFWAKSFQEELPTEGLKFTFIDKIEDVTDIINKKIADKEFTQVEAYTGAVLRKVAAELYKKSPYFKKKGIKALIRPFFAGNKFYLFYQKVYTDIRMVAAPPSAVGKFGGDTDNWMWPRHTGDFSVFRIYADANGEPAKYSAENVPLETKKHYTISLKGVEDGDYTMVMGFPGSTQRYLTAGEIANKMKTENDPRIQVRTARQNVLKEEMAKDEAVLIQYASKYAMSANYWKNAIGMNKAIVKNHVIESKLAQEKAFKAFATKVGNEEYLTVVDKINTAVAKEEQKEYATNVFAEIILGGIEFGTPYMVLDRYVDALKNKEDSLATEFRKTLTDVFESIYNKDYNHSVDKKVAQVILPLYATMVKKEQLPSFYTYVEKNYKGDMSSFIDAMYDNSIYSSKANFEKFLKIKSAKKAMKMVKKDAMYNYVVSKYDKLNEIRSGYAKRGGELNLLHKTYVKGLCEMNAANPQYPDANFTIRMTYGNVKSYQPKDGVFFDYYTTTNGILEKEDSTNREFNVPTKLKELILKKDFGRYAMKNGNMPVCFLSTNDITGGNSGSPVLNAKGELIGLAFDGNWESLSGDINFDQSKQRCINVDIRYVLFIIDKLGNNKRLIDEMTIAE